MRRCIINQAGALLDVQGDYSITSGYYGGQIVNAGTFRKSAGASNCVVSSIYFLNTGTVEALSGTIDLQAGGTLDGTWATVAGTTIRFSQGTFALTPSVVFSGAGFVGIDSGNPTLAGTLSTTLPWTGGTIAGNWTVATNGLLTLSGTGVKSLTGVLTNAGTVTLQSGLQFGYYYVQIVNQAGALLGVQGDYSITSGYGGQIVNAGTFRKSAGTGSCVVSIRIYFLNTGTVETEAGILQCDGGFIQSSGRTVLKGGNFASTSPIQIFGGTLSGVGTVTGDVTSSGNVSPGASPGLLTISGNYTQAVGGALSIELAGLVPGTSFDRLIVSGTASLAGALNLTLTNGFYPPTNANFSFLTCGTRTGTFGTFNYPSNAVGMQVNYTAINASAQVINVAPWLPVFASQTNDLC